MASFLKLQPNLHYRDWVLDSGAFTAHSSGKPIDLQKYIETCRELKANDPTLTEIFGLDVIGNYKETIRNCEKMWAAGIDAIPTYHVGEPEDALKTIARDYPKIALGGAVTVNGGPGKVKWAEQCFARVWPKRIHGFGFGGETAMLTLPFESIDASSWFTTPQRFGGWKTLDIKCGAGVKVNHKGSYKMEVDYWMELERLADHKWRQSAG